MRSWFALLLLLASLTVTAQQPSSAPDTFVRFSFDWNQGVPWQKYSIEVQSDGKTKFDGTPSPGDNRDTDPYNQDFTMSAANLQKVFALSKSLNYFRGDVDSHLKHIAQTGKKTLQYQSPQMQGAVAYNWSQNADVEELTRLFQAIAMTIDYGRKLTFQYRFDKLGMNQRLEELVQLQTDHGAEEIEIIAPILRKIAADPDMMNISRQNANRLLKKSNGDAQQVQTPASQ